MPMPTTPIRLYGHRISGHVHRVRLMLSLLGLPFEEIPVDFATGAIYLPGGQRSRLINVSGPDRSSGLELERIPLSERSLAAVEASLREHRGLEVDLAGHALRIERRVSEAELPVLLESLNRQASLQLAAR